MSWHREYKEQWKEIIETVAAEEHRTTQMVEKDTIQSMILSGISQSDLPFVFKGGTSLSKAYGLIDRFSEDIDLSMNRKPTEGEKKQTKNLILSLAEDLGLILTNPEDIQSRHGYNKYVFKYESFFSEIPLDHVHMFVSVYPQQSIPDVVKQIKGATSHKLREEFSQLKNMPSLWTRSYFVSTAGNVSSETIEWYVNTQKTRD